MRLLVDADACPGPIKEIIFRAANRCRVETTLFANHHVRVPKSPYLRGVQVEQGFDVADERILAALNAGDLVITGDIPLAAQVVEKQGTALNPRGTLYTADNIKEHLTRRDFLEDMRSTGAITGGPSALDKSHIQTFANRLDVYLTQHAGESAKASPP